MTGNNKKLKKLFNLLQKDSKSILFTECEINEKMLKNFKKWNYAKGNQFVKLFNFDYNFFSWK